MATVRHDAAPTVSRREAFCYWLKLGFISFGGPAGQISLMHQELVERRRWIGERRFLHALNYTMLLPGPEAQQLATYIGWLLHGTWGGLIAGGLFILPALVLLIVLSWSYLAFGDAPLAAGILYGIKPAVTAIVAFAAYRIGTRVLRNAFLWAVAAAALGAIFALRLPFPAIVLMAGLIGLTGSRFAPDLFHPQRHGDSRSPLTHDNPPAVIDDDGPLPAHARFNRGTLLRTVAVGLCLWATTVTALAAVFGWQATFTQMSWFFTKAALLTFGGAYAVLPYVYQGGVETYRWLSAPQMIDGLALGETTPGPLIMVVAFVGFLGGWQQTPLGAELPALAGVIGALIATLVTFLPSFLFILAGGPLVEATRNSVVLSAPLAAITAAVVGVIVNLALFFGYHVLWPNGFDGRFEWVAAVIGTGALVALFYGRLGVVQVIAGCAVAGIASQFFSLPAYY